MNRRTPLAFRAGAALAAALVLAAPAAAQQQSPSGGALRPRSTYEDLQMFSQVLNQIRVNHPDSVDTHELFMAAVEGMVRAADPHSYVIRAARLSPERQKDFEQGKLHPVPIEFSFFGGSPVVASVVPGSAAARQDILPGDLLVAVDDQPVRAESPFELMVMLAGPRNSTVRLGFERERVDGSTAVLVRDVRRERETDGPTPVPAAFLMNPEVGYIRITTFAHERAAEDLHAALQRLERAGMKRLVLDLRGNGGGRVDEARRIASEFLPAGAVVYTSEGRKPEVRDEARVRRSFWHSQRTYPIVLLVDEGTASASELVAGALQDHDRALVVGRPTFGKSLLMQGFPMSDGSIFVLVVGHVKTPCGRVIQRQYRDVKARDYYRLARAARDTVGRPTCRTTGGRTVYGGGGIYPDVVLPEPAPAPLWLARLREDDVHTRWIAAYLTEQAEAFTTLDALAAAPALPAGALAAFRAFAERQGHAVPAGAEVDERLQRVLLPEIAGVKWGPEGMYRMIAVLDPQVRAGTEQFARAGAILAGQATEGEPQ